MTEKYLNKETVDEVLELSAKMLATHLGKTYDVMINALLIAAHCLISDSPEARRDFDQSCELLVGIPQDTKRDVLKRARDLRSLMDQVELTIFSKEDMENFSREDKKRARIMVLAAKFLAEYEKENLDILLHAMCLVVGSLIRASPKSEHYYSAANKTMRSITPDIARRLREMWTILREEKN
jgi:hypothetical protein